MERDFSCIKLLDKVVHLSLPVTFISNEISGVIETLESWKRQYNPQLEGILVNYSNVSLISRTNKVIISRKGIIIDIKAVFHVFCPKVGDVVKGKVNRVSQELVGCIMHDTINATIYFSDYRPDELKKFIRVDREILFEIVHFSCYRSEVRVKGKITSDCLRLMTELYPDAEEEEKLTNYSFRDENNIIHYDFSNDIEECQVFKSEITADVPVVNVDESATEVREEPKLDALHKKSKKRKLDTSISGKESRKKQKKDNLPQLTNMNGDFIKLEDETVFDKELNCSSDSNLKKLKKPKKLKQSANDHPKKKKKQKKEKKDKKSKKGKVVATGTVVKSDKKKANKKKHLKKDKNKKKDKKLKTKKDHKKEKNKKLSDNLLNNHVEIKHEL